MPNTGGPRRGRPGRPPNVNEASLMRRLQCVLSVQNGEMDMDQACEIYNVSKRSFYRWLRSKSRLIELTGYKEEAQDQNRYQRPHPGRGRSPRKNVSEIPGNAKRMPRTNQRHRPVHVTELRSVRPIGSSHQRVDVSHRPSPANVPGTVSGEQWKEGGTGNQTPTLGLRKRSLTEPPRDGRNAKRGRDTLVSQGLTVFDEGEDMAHETLLQAGRLEGTLQNEGMPHSTSGMGGRNSQETPSSSIHRTGMYRGWRSQIPDRETGGLQRRVGRENSVRLASQNNASGPRAHLPPTLVSVAPVAYIDSTKHRLEIMSGRRKVVIAFYRGALAADIKDAISRRFALLRGAQWALTDQHGDEIVVSEGMPSGRYKLKVLG